MSIMLFVTDIIKGAVRGYERRLANGRVVQVSPHSNARGAAKDAHTADMFAKPKAPPMKPSPYSDECMKKPEKCTHDLFGGEGATAEQLHAAVQNSKASGVPIHKSVLFVTEDLLKATVKKELWIPAHTKKDGTFVHAHHKMVNVSDDHNDAKVGAGQGSHYQKAAHKKLVEDVHGFHTLSDNDKAMLVLAHATDLQADASLSAAVSGWKAAMLAGKEPTAGQKKAYAEYAAKYPAKVAKMATDIEAAIGAGKVDPFTAWAEFAGKYWDSNAVQEIGDVGKFIGTKDAGPASLMAFSVAAFMDINANPNSDEAKALLEYVGSLPDSNASAIHRVVAFGTDADRADFMSKLDGVAQDRTLSSWTEKDPAASGQTPVNNIALDVATQFGEKRVFMTIAGPKNAKDISFAYSKDGNSKPGTEVVLMRGTKLSIQKTTQIGDDIHVVLGHVEDGATGSKPDAEMVDVGGKSVIAEGGKPKVFYHGSADVIAPGTFWTPAFFTDSEASAKTYSGTDGAVTQVHLSIKNPAHEAIIWAAAEASGIDVAKLKHLGDGYLGNGYNAYDVFNTEELGSSAVNAVIAHLESAGFDGALIEHDMDLAGNKHKSWVAFSTPQIVHAAKPAMTPKEYGAAAFAAGIGAAPAMDKDFQDSHLSAPYSDYIAALKEWQAGWHGANLASVKEYLADPVPAPKHPDLKTGAVLKLDSQYSKMNSGEWTIYNQDDDNYQMHKVGATVPGAQNTVNIPKATLHASLASGTAKVVLHADDAPKDGDTMQGADGTLTFKDGRWHKTEDDKKKWMKKLVNQNLKTIEHNGSMWYVLAEGGKSPDNGTTLAHLASTDQGSYQKNGWNPKQASVWVKDSVLSGKPEIDPHTIPGVAGWHASLDAGKVPTVEQHDAMTNDGHSGLKHFDAAITKHGHAKVAHLIDQAGDQWFAAQTKSDPYGPSADALEAVLPYMSVLAHVPSDALERSLKVIAHNTGIKASALKAAVQHIKDESKKPVTPVGAPVMPDVPEPGVAPSGETVLFDSVNGHHVKVVKMPDGYYQSWINETLDGDGWSSSMYALDQAMQTAAKLPAVGSAAQAPVSIMYKGDVYTKNADGSWYDPNGKVFKHDGVKAGVLNLLSGEHPASGKASVVYELAVESAVQFSGADPIKMLDLAYHPGLKFEDGTGPNEGDVIEINGKNYVLHNGRWHLQADFGEKNEGVVFNTGGSYKLKFEGGEWKWQNSYGDWEKLQAGKSVELANQGKDHNGDNLVPVVAAPAAPSDVHFSVSAEDEHKLKLWIQAGKPEIDKFDDDMLNLWRSLTKDQQQYLKDNAAAPVAPAAQPETSHKWTVHLINQNPGHNKFYSLTVHGNVLTKLFGKIGQQGHSLSSTFSSNDKAVAAGTKMMEALVNPKKGYTFKPGHVPGYEAIATPVQPTVVVTKPAAKKKKLTKEQQIAAVPVPDYETIDPHQYSKSYANISVAIKNAVKNDGVKGLKNYVTFHNDGSVSAKKSVTGFGTGKCTALSNLVRRQLFYKFCQQMHAAALGKFDPEAAGVDPAALASAPAAAPAAPAAAQPVGPKDGDTKQGADGMLVFKNGKWHKVEPAAPISIAKSKLGDHVSVMDSWPQTGPQEGSNPGGKFKDKGGQEWYCKFPADAEMVRSEFLAAKFYQMMGVAVPTLKLVEKDGKLGIASKWVDGLKKGSADQLAGANGTHEAFAIDAWLGNWDVVGMTNDNLKLNKDGSAVRVDVGGSLNYRAQGGKKGADFGDNVVELKTMKDHSKNDKSAPVFAGASPAAMAWGGGQLNKLKPSQIEELCKIAGPGTDAEKAALAKKLIARRADVLKQMGIVDQWDKPPVDTTKLHVPPADLTHAAFQPIDFMTVNGGKPLSSKEFVNNKNSADSAALVAFAAQGNLDALKNYQFDAIDKDTGQSVGKKPITEHPAKLIAAQWTSLIELLQSIAYPPAESLNMPPLGSASDLESISDMVGFFSPTERVETVSADLRMHFFMKLGEVEGIEELTKDMKWHHEKKDGPWIKAQFAKYKSVLHDVRAYIDMVQDSGWINHLWSQGKTAVSATSIGKHLTLDSKIGALTSKIYAESVEIPEGTILKRGMYDTSHGTMINQFLNAKPGLVIQNTDSMCASYFEGHSWSGDVQMTIRCMKGCKASASFASGRFGGENEVTTLPGQRYVLLKSTKTGGGVHLDVLMLPPDQGYVAEVNKLKDIGKAFVVYFKEFSHG